MEQVFGIESVLNRDKTSIGLELDVVCGKHAWEYGSWFWHKPKRKQAIDLESMNDAGNAESHYTSFTTAAPARDRKFRPAYVLTMTCGRK